MLIMTTVHKLVQASSKWSERKILTSDSGYLSSSYHSTWISDKQFLNLSHTERTCNEKLNRWHHILNIIIIACNNYMD